MDEPSLGLAPLIIEEIFHAIQSINADGTPILLVEQNSNAALQIATYGYVMELGEIKFSDTAANLLKNEKHSKDILGNRKLIGDKGMKYGCCSNMLARGEVLVKSNFIGMLAACGYDYIELSVVDCIRLTPADRLELKKRLDGTGLRAEVFNSLFPRELKTTGPDVDPKRVQDWYMQALELASSFGAKYVVYGSPYSKSYPLGYDRARAYEQLLLLHRAMDEYAGQLEMSILIEPCHRLECNLINTFAEGVELAKCVAGKNTAVILTTITSCAMLSAWMR